MLTTAQFERARAFLGTTRPLTQARFAYHFEEGPAAAVLAALATFQNNDGGFGRGLEPDFSPPQSSVLATTVALQICGDIDAGTETPLVQRAIAYLVAQYDEQRQAWPIIPAHDNSQPHAPWWHDEPGEAGRRYGRFNPAAEAVGYLWRYQALAPASLREAATTVVLTHLRARQAAPEMHDLLCLQRLAAAEALPAAVRDEVVAWLRPWLPTVVTTEAADWGGYGLQPLDVAPAPDAVFAADLAESLPANLAWRREQQQADGSWQPAWSWGENFPQAWAQAKRAWAGVLTLSNLRLFQAYGWLG